MGGGPIKQRYGYEDDYRMRNAALGMDFDTTGYMPDALELSALTVRQATKESIERSKQESGNGTKSVEASSKARTKADEGMEVTGAGSAD